MQRRRRCNMKIFRRQRWPTRVHAASSDTKAIDCCAIDAPVSPSPLAPPGDDSSRRASRAFTAPSLQMPILSARHAASTTMSKPLQPAEARPPLIRRMQAARPCRTPAHIAARQAAIRPIIESFIFASINIGSRSAPHCCRIENSVPQCPSPRAQHSYRRRPLSPSTTCPPFKAPHEGVLKLVSAHEMSRCSLPSPLRHFQLRLFDGIRAISMPWTMPWPCQPPITLSPRVLLISITTRSAHIITSTLMMTRCAYLPRAMIIAGQQHGYRPLSAEACRLARITVQNRSPMGFISHIAYHRCRRRHRATIITPPPYYDDAAEAADDRAGSTTPADSTGHHQPRSLCATMFHACRHATRAAIYCTRATSPDASSMSSSPLLVVAPTPAAQSFVDDDLIFRPS